MANDQISTWYSTMFSSMMHVKAQQRHSRLRSMCKPISDKNAEEGYYDGIGLVEARTVTERQAPSTFDSIEHFRRKITKEEFVVTLPIAQRDVESVLTDPQGAYAEACINALERKIDLIIYQAMFADVYTGKTGSTQVTAAADGVLTVNATAGLTLAKLLEIKQNFIDNEVVNEDNPRILYGIAGSEHTALLSLATLTSGDYSRQMSLENGEIQKAVGMELIKFGANTAQPVLNVSGGVRTSFAMTYGSIALWVSRDWQVTVKDRPDLINTMQVQATGVVGALRTEGKLIQKVTTTP